MYSRLCADVGDKPLNQRGLADASLPCNGDDPAAATSDQRKRFRQAFQLLFALQ
jgi:hypothetical protein